MKEAFALSRSFLKISDVHQFAEHRNRSIVLPQAVTQVRFGGNLVMAFDYPTEKAFEALQSSVNARGDMVGPAIIDWSNPHL